MSLTTSKKKIPDLERMGLVRVTNFHHENLFYIIFEKKYDLDDVTEKLSEYFDKNFPYNTYIHTGWICGGSFLNECGASILFQPSDEIRSIRGTGRGTRDFIDIMTVAQRENSDLFHVDYSNRPFSDDNLFLEVYKSFHKLLQDNFDIPKY